MIVYLDSSAIVKRYIEEKGSEVIDSLYAALENEEIEDQILVFSAWNLGEVCGAIDTRQQRGDLDEKSSKEAFNLFAGETKKFVSMRRVNVLPVSARLLTNSRALVLKYHIYQADALQLASAKLARAEIFVSADRKLIDCGKLEKFETANPERDSSLIEESIAKKD